jgi:small subunit ribosomal protein S17e
MYLSYYENKNYIGDNMGRIRTKWVKGMAKRLIEQYPDKFNNNFEDNKKNLNELELISDKPVRNKVAGYITTIVKKRRA